ADLALTKKLGTEFQDFFSSVATALWGSDYEDRRPQGKVGDKKCDGYLKSVKVVFQCYAPRSMHATTLKAKIDENFNGARIHFGSLMQGWRLIHNDWQGLPTEAHELMMKLQQTHSQIAIETWGPKLLQEKIMELPRHKLALLFPGVPPARELRRITFGEIDDLISTIDSSDPTPTLDTPLAPSPDKVAHNKLPEHIVQLLRH